MVESKRIQRLYEKVVSNRKNCSYDDLERLLLAVGFTLRFALSVPFSRPVKENYVEQALAILQELGL